AGGPVPGQVHDVLDGPASVAVDAVGVSATMADALAATAPGARVVLVGMGSPRLDLAAYAISTEERDLIGTFSYPAAEFAAVAEWVAGAPEDLAGLIERQVSLAEAPGVFAALAEDLSVAGKVLVRC
ncbi:zinc-binding dehydrogenase, partial [Actinoallomurus acaciae]